MLGLMPVFTVLATRYPKRTTRWKTSPLPKLLMPSAHIRIALAMQATKPHRKGPAMKIGDIFGEGAPQWPVDTGYNSP
jgi:hypothetical protein